MEVTLVNNVEEGFMKRLLSGGQNCWKGWKTRLEGKALRNGAPNQPLRAASAGLLLPTASAAHHALQPEFLPRTWFHYMNSTTDINPLRTRHCLAPQSAQPQCLCFLLCQKNRLHANFFLHIAHCRTEITQVQWVRGTQQVLNVYQLNERKTEIIGNKLES